MSDNKPMHRAKGSKNNDEFYTRREDIESELKNYRDHFKGKTIYCNCDDPQMSEFYKYFYRQFGGPYEPKKLIASCYKSMDLINFSKHDSEKARYQIYDGKGKSKPANFDGDGDFRSEESIELLKQADIVVTNPPFSLFREYVAQLIKYKKKFIIVGNQASVVYKEIFPLIKENKIWLGTRPVTKFEVPDDYEIKNFGGKYGERGLRIMTIGFGAWFTNIEHKVRNDEMVLFAKYNPEDYPHYDNYDAINVDKTVDIPKDWKGEMGIPVSFLQKYNPAQFEIVGLDRYILRERGNSDGNVSVNGKMKYHRIIIKNRKPK